MAGPDDTSLILGPLHAQHEALGATMTGFAGYSMPLRYTSEIAEHEAVRNAAGLFDVSHMGEIFVAGPGAADALDYALVGRISAVAVGRAKYTMLCADDGGVLDDLIVYRTGDTDYMVVANAGNAPLVAHELVARCARFECSIVDASRNMSLIAVQGPRAVRIVANMLGADAPIPIDEMRYYSSQPVVIDGAVPATLGRTGYTGEDGFEMFVPASDAERVWDAALRHGVSQGIVACGLAARDSLRLEAGMPLHGSEIGPDRTPYEAGLGRVVALDTPDGEPREFVGAEALRAAAARDNAWREAPGDAPADARVLYGLIGDGKRAARAGYTVHDAAGASVGTVTSGAPSPTLGRQIAMAYVHPRVAAEGVPLSVDVRGRAESMAATPLPFYAREQ